LHTAPLQQAMSHWRQIKLQGEPYMVGAADEVDVSAWCHTGCQLAVHATTLLGKHVRHCSTIMLESLRF
jgi:hypothetical protein